MKNQYLISGEIKELTFEELAQEMEGILYKFTFSTNDAVSHLSKWIDQDDVYQSMLITLWKASRSYDIERGHFSTYLTWKLMANRKEIIRYLGRGRQSGVLNVAYIEGMPGIQHRDEEYEQRLMEDEIIQQLAPGNDYIFDYILDKIDYKTLSESIGLSDTAIYNRINKTKKQIEDYLSVEVA